MGAREVRSIIREHRAAGESASDILRRERKLVIRRAIHRAGKTVVAEFETHAKDLHRLLRKFDAAYGLGSAIGHEQIRRGNQEKSLIRIKAHLVRDAFLNLVPLAKKFSSHEWDMGKFASDREL